MNPANWYNPAHWCNPANPASPIWIGNQVAQQNAVQNTETHPIESPETIIVLFILFVSIAFIAFVVWYAVKKDGGML